MTYPTSAITPDIQRWINCDEEGMDCIKCNRIRAQFGFEPIPDTHVVPFTPRKVGRKFKALPNSVGFRPQQASRQLVFKDGTPGDELKLYLEELGLGAQWCETCEQWRQKMNVWGCAGCRTNINAIAQRLKQAEDDARVLGNIGVNETVVAAWGIVWNTLIKGEFVNPLDRYKSIALVAIERAEKKRDEAKKETLGESNPC